MGLHILDSTALANRVIDNAGRIIESDSACDLLARTLEALQRGTEVEISFGSDPICSLVFERHLRLRTFTGMTAATLDLIEDSTVDHMQLVAESGDWLCHDPVKSALIRASQRNDGIKVDLVVAFEHLIPEVCSAFATVMTDGALDFEVKKVPWYRHNRHMTIAFAGHSPVGGVYFARANRNQFITPVALSGIDSRTLQRDFSRLWKSPNAEPVALVDAVSGH